MTPTAPRKVRCEFCTAILLVRPDQLGRRLRCSKCRYVFVAILPEPREQPEKSEPPASDEVSKPEAEAEDAKEMVLVPPPLPPRTWNRAKIAARFERPATLVFDAFAQAIRGCNCDVLDVDRVNLRIRFAFAIHGQGSEHMCSFFFSGERSSDLEIVSWGPNTENQFDPFYETIVREVGKYLMFAAAPPTPFTPDSSDSDRDPDERRDRAKKKSKRRSRRQDRDDDDEDKRDEEPGDDRPWAVWPPAALDDRHDETRQSKRARSQAASDSSSIAGFVCGLVGLILFWIPIVGVSLGILGIVLGLAMLNDTPRHRPKNGLGIAGLVLGAVACLLSLLIFVVYLGQIHRYGF